MAKYKEPPAAFQDAQLLWECDFPNRPDLLEQLVKERVRLKEEQDSIKEQIDNLNNSLLPFLKRNGLRGFYYGDMVIHVQQGTTVTLDKTKLVEAGVAADLIDRCTNKTPWETVAVRVSKK